MFVGITRAEKELQLSYAAKRLRQGTMSMACASRFLMELPRGEMEIVEPPSREQYAVDREYEFDEPSYQVNDFEEETPRDAEKRAPAKIVTAAEMLDGGIAKPPQVPLDQFKLGILVSHPEYGTGKIIALGGDGKKRMATIDFFKHGQEKILLAYAQLIPIVSQNS